LSANTGNSIMKTPIDYARSLPENPQPAVVDQALRDIASTPNFNVASLDTEVFDMLGQKSGWERSQIEQKLTSFHDGAGRQT
jgi:hypothetical protein